jgi:hypothetical protein
VVAKKKKSSRREIEKRQRGISDAVDSPAKRMVEVQCLAGSCRRTARARGLCKDELAAISFFDISVAESHQNYLRNPDSSNDESEGYDPSLPPAVSRLSSRWQLSQRRPYFPYDKDMEATLALSVQISDALFSNAVPFMHGKVICARDHRRWPCRSCTTATSGPGAGDSMSRLRTWPQRVRLRTLTQGTIDVFVQDGQCLTCLHISPWDGSEIAVYRSNKTTAYTHELLQHWLHGVAGRGHTFRSTYDVWCDVDSAASLTKLWRAAGTYNGTAGTNVDAEAENPRILGRIAANDALIAT